MHKIHGDDLEDMISSYPGDKIIHSVEWILKRGVLLCMPFIQFSLRSC
jgi:hypothetical protein